MLQEKDLLNLGLTKNESEIYLILSKLKESKAYDISKYTKISRSHVYDSINNLIAKGLINYITKDKKRLYQITNPDNLINLIEDKENQLTKQKEELKEKIEILKENENISPSKVEVYEGLEGIKYILNDVLKDGQNKKYKEILIMNSFSKEEFIRSVPEYIWERFWNLRQKYKISSRQLYAKGKKITEHKYIKYKILPKEYFNDKIVHSIYGNKMIYFIFSLQPLAIKIENEEITKLYTNQFEILWEIAK